MDTLVIRKAMPSDIPGICLVNRGEPGPWEEPEKCEAHVLTRLKNGFYIQVAERAGQIVGHAEWIVSDAYRGKSLYLGQLQVEPKMQKQGIGRRMIEDGVRYAKENGCGCITLIPEQKTGSQDFYKKCGFAKGADILRVSLPAKEGDITGKCVKEAPHRVVKELPFVFGLTQTSAEHMWQVIDRESSLSGRMVDTILGEDFCIQLAGFDKTKNALVLAWARGDIQKLVRMACAFAHECGYPGADFVLFPEYEAAFPGIEAEREDFEMILKL